MTVLQGWPWGWGRLSLGLVSTLGFCEGLRGPDRQKGLLFSSVGSYVSFSFLGPVSSSIKWAE